MKIYSQLLILSITLFIFTIIQVDAQKWHQIEEESITNKRSNLTREIIPAKYKTYSIDIKSLRSTLERSPSRFKNEGSTTIILDMPLADGTFKQFSITRSDVFHPELAARYPLIKSFTGTNIEDPTSILKLSISHRGINGMILSDSQPTVYIDRYAKEMDDTYIVYYKNDFSKHLQDGEGHCTVETPNDNFQGIADQAKYGDCQLRQYRLALACTGEYATFHGGNKPDVLAAFNASLTRLNGIYEREFTITMQLIANTDELIYLNSTTDPYTNDDGGTMLGENQANIDDVIGFNNYDIGHVYSTGGGGIASLRSPCTTRKARGVTGLGSPIGDPFWVDYVAHEMGHQFGGNHTQNNDCNRNQSTAMEPGSASTIMGYAGICEPNVQNNSDDYFHSISIQEVANFVVGGNGDCAEIIPIDNSAPELAPLFGNALVLPISTPFELIAVATDAENDAITYCWEQQDNETANMPPESTSTGGPAFRSYNPTTSPSRFFPRMSSILLGNNGNTWETLPSVSRTMNFNVTVRDNHALGGCTEDDNLSISFTNEAGPFSVTSQNASTTWNAGSAETISWDVANTDQSPVSCAEVNIFLSLDGGDNFDILIAENTENDGTHEVQVPFQFSDQCRLMIKCASSIFLDINDSDFSIIAPFSAIITPESILACKTETAVYTIDYTEFAEDIEVTFSIEGLPIGAIADFSTNPVTEDGMIDLTISGLENVIAGEYPMTVTFMSPELAFNQEITLIVSLQSAPNIEYLSPLDAETNVSAFPTLTWQDDPTINQYEVQLSENPSFDNILISQMTNKPSTSGLSLESQTIYYWRVRVVSDCFESDWNKVQSFQTAGLTCFNQTIIANIEIPATSGNITSSAIVTSTNFVDLVEMSIKIDHTWVGDLLATLESPSGTVDTLFDRPGVPQSNFGCGNDNIDIQLSDFATNTADDLENTCEPGNLAISGSFQPINPFSAFNGENMLGVWTLTITDSFDDDSGELVEWSLSTCSSALISSAIIINNNDHVLLNENEKVITTDLLLVENNDPENVLFVLRTPTQNGNLQKFNPTSGIFENMELGSIFTQNDVDQGNINFVVTNLDEISDSFMFDVVDDQGRYAANQIFNISYVFEGLSVAASITNTISCFEDNDGEITASGNGGIAPLMYSNDGENFTANPVFSNLVSGTYTITVRDNNGDETSTNPIIITEPPLLELTAGFNENQLTIEAFGGTGSYSYSIDGINYSDENVYTLSDGSQYNIGVKDENDCTIITGTFIHYFISAATFSTSNVSCNGLSDGSLTVVSVVGGLSPYTYTIDGIVNGTGIFEVLSAGTFELLISDSFGNEFVQSVTITEPDLLELFTTVNQDTVFVQGQGGVPPYLFSLNGAIFLIDSFLIGQVGEIYTVYIIDQNG
ncbi:MAG: subtilisin-like proprotein convertase family protein, partial [Saprospiraceae bacterium]